MQFSEIQERLKALKREIIDLRAANTAYRSQGRRSAGRRSPVELYKHNQRELRLQQILEELTLLKKTEAP